MPIARSGCRPISYLAGLFTPAQCRKTKWARLIGADCLNWQAARCHSCLAFLRDAGTSPWVHWGAGYANASALNTNGHCFGNNSRGPCGPITDSNFFQGRTQVGWVAGFGIEHIFASMPRWMFRLEAMWVDLGKSTVVNPGSSFVNGVPGPYYSEFQNQALLARVGVSYKIW